MKTITNKTLWSKAGFVEFADRDAAVAFWNACRARNLAVYGGIYQSEVTGWAFYYIAKAAGYPEGRIDDYAAYTEDRLEKLEVLDAEMQRENALDAATAHRQFDAEAPTNAVLGGVTKVAPFFSTRIDPIHHYPLN